MINSTCKQLFYIILIASFIGNCCRVNDSINPSIDCAVQDQYLSHLKNGFYPLTPAEKQTDWGKEMIIAKAFADGQDLYRAVSTYKRADILVDNEERKLEIQYYIVFSFYLAKHYQEAILAFETSKLPTVDRSFQAYHDLLLVLYECYREIDWPEKEDQILEMIQKSYPHTAAKLKLSRAIREGDLAKLSQSINPTPDFINSPSLKCCNDLNTISSSEITDCDSFSNIYDQKGPSTYENGYLEPFLNHYEMQKKSVRKAQVYNALFPGAGYLYLGQKKSAFTAFLLNGLFIAAATQFFIRGNIPAGIITTGFEAGWYFGGIYGAGEEAKFYNERIYERAASQVLNEKNLFPILMMNYGF